VTNSNSTEKKDIRKFGLIALIFFGSLCALGMWRQKPIPIYLFGTLATLGLGFLLIPGPLRPLYKGWLRVAHFIGKTITVILLSVAYYLVITPSAMIKRVFGGRPLPVKPSKKLTTYWVERSEPAQPRDRFTKRF